MDHDTALLITIFGGAVIYVGLVCLIINTPTKKPKEVLKEKHKEVAKVWKEHPRILHKDGKKMALITGIAGQDAAYLAKLLLEKDYWVIGVYRRNSTGETNYFWRLHLLGIFNHERLIIEVCDITDPVSCNNIITKYPEICEVYNLAAQSFVKESFNGPTSTLMVDGIGACNILESVRSINPNIRMYQASTSELYGKVQSVPQTEKTPFYPRSPYSCAKQYAHNMVINYRESYGIYACCGILFNHESILRGEEFITRKIAKGVVAVAKEAQEFIEVGNLNAERDWGFAGDYVEAMYLMLQQETAEEFVIATNTTYSVRYFITESFRRVGTELEWSGHGENETATNLSNGKVVVKVNPKFYRPAEVDQLIGEYEKAKSKLGWSPKMNINTLIETMVDYEELHFHK